MLESARALLSGVVDYAGALPPAGLPLEVAARRYREARRSPEGWMLGRFVCPATRLRELQTVVEKICGKAEPPVRVSVLGRGAESVAEFAESVGQDGGDIRRLRAGDAAALIADAYETCLPPAAALGGDAAVVMGLAAAAADRLAAAGLRDAPCLFEMPLGGHWREEMGAVTLGLAAFNLGLPPDALPRGGMELAEMDARTRRGGGAPAGLKLCCGGAEASAFPDVEPVAFVIEACRERGVPLKFAAGLDHPVRHRDASVGSHRHGFLNVLGATVLAYALGLGHHDVLAILEEEDPRAFSLTNECFGWNEGEATVDEIRYARRHRVISFAGCSFDEPVEGLKRMGLL